MGQGFLCSWSGGKDSGLALYRAISAGGNPKLLLTMMTEEGYRSRSHGLRREVLNAQAEAIGVPIRTFATSWPNYEASFRQGLAEAWADGIHSGVFGDIDIESHRAWVENVCAAEKIQCQLPLWQSKRENLLSDLLQLGFRAEIIAIKDGLLTEELLGQSIDEDVLSQFRDAGIDLSGEKGEYHTVVTDGPIFKTPVHLKHQERVLRDGYWFSDAMVLKGNLE